jgi:hypothetical protein
MTDPPDRLTETPQIRRLSDQLDQMIDGLAAAPATRWHSRPSVASPGE